MLYLGEINDSQQASWLRCIEAIEEGSLRQLRLALFPADRAIPAHAADIGVQVRLAEFTLQHPRQWGACWVVCQLWTELHLDQCWRERLPPSREGTSWSHVLLVLGASRVLAPGSEWRLHRERTRIFLMTSGCSMNARIRMAPPQREQASGSASYTCLMSRAQARFTSEGAILLDSTMAVDTSPCAFRRVPRLALLYQP